MTTIPVQQERALPGAPFLLIFCVVAALLSLVATAFSPDPLFRLQGYIFTAAFAIGFLRPDGGPYRPAGCASRPTATRTASSAPA